MSTSIKTLTFLLAIFLSACSTVVVQDYIHEPTQNLRQSIIYSGHTELDGIDENKFVIVPNFRTFTQSFSANRAVLIIVSDVQTSITFSSASLTNKDTGEVQSIELNEEYLVSKPVPETGYFLGFVSIFDHTYEGYEKFNSASELELEITYTISGGRPKTESLLLKLITKKEVAWVA